MKPNKFKDNEYVIRVKEKGRGVRTFRFKGKSLADIRLFVQYIISISFYDTRWTICENGCEVKRGTHIWD